MSEEAIKQILLEIEKENAIDETGELREGLRNTPKRVVESWAELYSGYKQNPKETLNATFNGEGYDGIVLLKDIEFYSTCEHHMLSFTGKPHVGDSLVSGYRMYDYCNTTCGYYHMQQVNNFWK